MGRALTLKTLTALLGALALVFWGSQALAQDAAAAQALFEHGVRELDAGRFEDACPLLAESQRIDPHPGTLFALAECEAKAGKAASAVGHYQDYLGLVSRLPPEQFERHAERAANARAQVDALRPSVPTLALVLPASAPHGVVVERDGMALQGPALATELPVDPGEHVIVTRLADGSEKRVNLTLALGEHKRLELELPAPAPAPAAISPAGVHPGESQKLESAREPSELRTWGWALGGIGLTAVVAGSITGVVVLQKKATVTDHCDGSACDHVGKTAADSGQTLAAVSTVLFGVGISAVAVSIALLIATEPSSAKPAAAFVKPRLSAGPGGVWAGLERDF